MKKITIALLLCSGILIGSCIDLIGAAVVGAGTRQMTGMETPDLSGNGTQLWIKKIPEPVEAGQLAEKHIASFDERSYCMLVAKTMSEVDPTDRWFCH